MSSTRDHLAASALFHDLPEELVTALNRRAELVEIPLGKALQRAGQLPPGVGLVLSGRLRQVYAKPGLPPRSVGSIEPGQWLGWASVVRGESDLTVSASLRTVMVMIPLADALAAVQEHSQLQHRLALPLIEECAALLLPALEEMGRRVDDPRELLQALMPQIQLLGPQDALPVANHLLLFSGPRPAKGPAPGELLVAGQDDWRQTVNRLPTRVLAVPEEALAAALDASPADTTSALTLRPEQRPTSLASSAPVEPTALGFPAIGSSLEANSFDNQTFVGGASSRVDQALACIAFLATSRRLAFSEKHVRQNLLDVEQRLGGLNLPQVGLQLEALGFDTRPLRARPHELTRLDPPALLDLDGAFVLLLVASGGGGVLVGDPRHGLRRFSLRQLADQLPQGTDILVIREGRTERRVEEGFGLAWFLPAFLSYPGLLSLTLLTAFLSQLLSAVFPIGVLMVIDQVITQNNPSLLVPLSAILIASALAGGVLRGARAMISADLSDRVDGRLGSSVVEHLLRLPIPYFERRQVGGILYNVNQLYNLRQFVVDQLLGVGLDVVFAVVFFLVLLWISPTLTLVVVVVAPILVLLNTLASPLLIRLIRQSNHYAASAGSFLYEVTSGIRTVKSQNFEVEARWQWLERYRTYTAARFRITQLSSLISESGTLLSNVSDIALIVVGAGLILSNKLTLGGLFAVKILAGQVVNPVLRLSNLWQGFQEMRLSLACLADVMLALPEVGGEDLQAPPLPQIRGDIRFDDVSFRYGTKGRLILDRLDLTISSGQFVGIVGLSGSGKSTLVQLIDRLYTPKQGRIFLDDFDIAKVQLASLRRRIGYLPQDSLLFEGSVLDNIRLNNPRADIEAVMEAARVAAAHDFILELENGYSTKLGERGAGLSGGQRQRICLARTVLQDPSLLILDEATSALDAETEKLVCRNLARRFAGSTVLFITHRLTTLQEADRILFMDKGRIIEDGSHSELLAQRGAYATLYNQQVGEGSQR